MTAQFEKLYAEAQAAGLAAGMKTVPDTMVVTGMGKTYVETEGPCGFAWVVVKPGNSAFAKWLKAKGYAHKHYAGGVSIWISEYGQSADRKAAHAYAMSKVFQIAGIKAYADSRLD